MSSTPIKPEIAITFLREASRFFQALPTGGEDSVFWANVTNAETCARIADLIETQLIEPAPTQATEGEKVA